MTVRSDPKLYREMSMPFDSNEQANQALQAFFTDVEAARRKHRIADIAVLCEITHVLAGKEVLGGASLFLGDSSHHLPMLAREYGAAHQNYEDMLKLIIANARRPAEK